MTLRFVHTADIHLDSPPRSLVLRNSELAELVGDASRQAFAAIVDLCLAERVDALVVAGGLYDGDQTSMKTARFLASQMTRLHRAGVRVYMIRGNHDAMSGSMKICEAVMRRGPFLCARDCRWPCRGYHCRNVERREPSRVCMRVCSRRCAPIRSPGSQNPRNVRLASPLILDRGTELSGQRPPMIAFPAHVHTHNMFAAHVRQMVCRPPWGRL